MIAVQRAYHACMYFLEDRSGTGSERVWDWVRHTRRAYRIGLLVFLADLALAVAPKHVTGVQGIFRLAAVVVASGACVMRPGGWPGTCGCGPARSVAETNSDSVVGRSRLHEYIFRSDVGTARTCRIPVHPHSGTSAASIMVAA